MFAEEENFPINQKIFHFSTFSKIPKFYSSGPISMPIFRQNRESGNFSNWKIFHFSILKKVGLKKVGVKNGSKKKWGKKKVG